MPTPYEKSSVQTQHVPAKVVPKEGETPTQQAAIAPGQSIPTTTTLAALVPLIFTNKSAALVDGNLRVTAIDAQSFILDWGTAQQPTAAYMYVQSRPIAPNTIAVQ